MPSTSCDIIKIGTKIKNVSIADCLPYYEIENLLKFLKVSYGYLKNSGNVNFLWKYIRYDSFTPVGLLMSNSNTERR
jgi:hypothetical protein